jgi:hypothetical protein
LITRRPALVVAGAEVEKGVKAEQRPHRRLPMPMPMPMSMPMPTTITMGVLAVLVL